MMMMMMAMVMVMVVMMMMMMLAPCPMESGVIQKGECVKMMMQYCNHRLLVHRGQKIKESSWPRFAQLMVYGEDLFLIPLWLATLFALHLLQIVQTHGGKRIW